MAVPPRSGPNDGTARFTQWYRGDWPNLVLFAILLGAGQQQAEDLVQDAATEAFARRDGIDSLGGYARVSIRNGYFKLSARKSLSLRWEIADDLSEDLPAPEDPSMGSVEFADQERRVFAAIRRLPKSQREVMAWSIDGYTPTEIAKHVGATPGAVRVRLCNARARLKEELLPGWGGED